MVYNQKFVVVVKVNGKVLRELGENVYIPFGSEYSVLLKNLNSVKAVASMSIDDEDIMDGSEVIVPANSEVELEGFMKGSSVTNRFKFIEKTDQISEYRGNKAGDGLLRVAFKFEQKNVQGGTLYRNPYNEKFPANYPTYPFSPMTWHNHNVHQSGPTCGGDNNVFASSSLQDTSVRCCASIPENDEGITVKGSSSDQVFTAGTTNVLEYEEHVIVLQLKGVTKTNKVKKPLTVRTKVKCSTCGKKNKSNNRYCNNCGTALF